MTLCWCCGIKKPVDVVKAKHVAYLWYPYQVLSEVCKNTRSNFTGKLVIFTVPIANLFWYLENFSIQSVNVFFYKRIILYFFNSNMNFEKVNS